MSKKTEKQGILKEVSVTIMGQKGTVTFFDESDEAIIAKIQSMFVSVIIHSITSWQASLTNPGTKEIQINYELEIKNAQKYLKK